MILLAGEGEDNQYREDEHSPAWDTGEHPKDYADGFSVCGGRGFAQRVQQLCKPL